MKIPKIQEETKQHYTVEHQIVIISTAKNIQTSTCGVAKSIVFSKILMLMVLEKISKIQEYFFIIISIITLHKLISYYHFLLSLSHIRVFEKIKMSHKIVFRCFSESEHVKICTTCFC